MRVPDRFEFAFGCSAGHTVSLETLFATQRKALQTCFEAMIATWERSIAQVTEGAEIAERNGAADLARRLRARVAALEEKVQLLRKNFLPDL